LFQSLIGRLKTGGDFFIPADSPTFQSLIGRLKTRIKAMREQDPVESFNPS